MKNQEQSQVTRAQIQEHLGYGRGNRVVQIDCAGSVYYSGSTDYPFLFSEHWYYAGEQVDIATEIRQRRRVNR